MSSGAALPSHFDSSHRKIQIIMNDQHTFLDHVIIIHTGLDRTSAQVHVCFRAEKNRFSSLKRHESTP